MITLEKYNEKYINDFIEYINEFKKYGDEFHVLSQENFLSMSEKEIRDYFPTYIKNALDFEKQETVPIKGYVSASAYFIVRDGKMIGEISLRHRLTPHLIELGGHVGYKIKHSERGKGYGTEALKQIIQKAWDRGLTELQIGCDDKNKASAALIEKVGGHLHKVSDVEFFGKKIIRKEYWIFKNL